MNLIERVKALLFSPKTEWEVIAKEETSTSKIIGGYLLPLVLIPVVATFISYAVIGYKIPFFGYIQSVELGIRSAISMLISLFAGALLTAYIIDSLAASFGAEKNLNKAMQLVVFSYTPSLIGGIFYIYYGTAFLGGLLGLYGLYLLFLGLKPMMKVGDDKQVTYFVVSLVVTIAVSIVLSLVLTSILVTSSLGYHL
jgi:hypothetical protein